MTGDILEPDPIAFLEANPYNIRHIIQSIGGAAATMYYGQSLSDDQVEGLIYAGLWHAPVWGIHIAHKLGAFAGHTGGFGYYKTLAMFPMLSTALGYYTVGREVVAAPYRSVAYTGVDTMRLHVGGTSSFINPITGL